MNPSNKEMQLRKNCELYIYVLASLQREIPEEIVECAMSYDYPVECVGKLSALIESLDEVSFKQIVSNSDSQEARDLANWWEMRQEADRLHRSLSFDE